MKPPKSKESKTSWGTVSNWYSDYLENNSDTYQKQVILPNILRVIGIRPSTKIIDIACGQGFFSRAMHEAGAKVVGTDISPELITEAKKLSPKEISYHVAPADNIKFAPNNEFDVAAIVLAIQNIENMKGTFEEAARVLKKGGRLVLVMMHPAFRNPGQTSWEFDKESGAQYRRVDKYLSANKAKLLVNPSKKNSETTTSYHRSLQDFSKALFKAGFSIAQFEEWISHKKSEKGPRQKVEDTARKEIPLFLMIEAKKE